MFWGAFSYDKKGPCHVWQPETPKQKREATAAIDKLNEEREPIFQKCWEREQEKLRERQKLEARTSK